MAKGIVMREAHFPGRAPIDAYGDGGFRFAEMSHRGSIYCMPGGIFGWKANRPLTVPDFEPILKLADTVEFLLIGVGEVPFPLSADIRDALKTVGLRHDVMTTGAAVRTYNVLLAEDRVVGAALVAV